MIAVYMRRFFLAFPKVHTLCKQLNWSHYRTLIAVEDSKARQFYFEEYAKANWSVSRLFDMYAKLTKVV